MIKMKLQQKKTVSPEIEWCRRAVQIKYYNKNSQFSQY